MSKILITSKVIVFTDTNGKTITVLNSHDNFIEVGNALKTKNIELATQLMGTPSKQKRVTIKGNDLYFEGQRFNSIFAEAFLSAKEHGLSTKKLDAFFNNLKKNPSPISIDAFTSFTAKSKMPITDRGTFLAYKKVNKNFKDIYTSTFDNRPGSVCTMERSKVDNDQSATCSTGFHVCSHTYLNQFGSDDDPQIVVEIHPKDVVAVPPDYQMTKMRVSSYRVLCTLDYFRKKLLSYNADALGMIPIFNTSFTKTWNVMSDIPEHCKSKSKTFKTPIDWIKSRELSK